MSDLVQPHRRQPTRLPSPWDSPGKNTGVGCHCLPQFISYILTNTIQKHTGFTLHAEKNHSTIKVVLVTLLDKEVEEIKGKNCSSGVYLDSH